MTSPHPAPRSRKKVVRAYAVFPNYSTEMLGMFMGLKCIFATEKQARAALKFDDRLSRIAGRRPPRVSVVPVDVSYTLPTIKSSKRRRKV